MKNNTCKPRDVLRISNVIYKFKCPLPHGQVTDYIWMTVSQNGYIFMLKMGQLKNILKVNIFINHPAYYSMNSKIIGTGNIRPKLAIKGAILTDSFKNLKILLNYSRLGMS